MSGDVREHGERRTRASKRQPSTMALPWLV